MIDLLTKQIESLPLCRERSNACASYYNNCVFLFGGCETNCAALNNTDMFDLDNKVWKKLTDLPMLSRDTSAVLVYNFFVVSDSVRNIYKYDIFLNSFDILNSMIQSSSHNILIKDFDKIYFAGGRSGFQLLWGEFERMETTSQKAECFYLSDDLETCNKRTKRFLLWLEQKYLQIQPRQFRFKNN